MAIGFSTRRYVMFMCAAMLAAFAGSQCVHMYYKPLEGFETQMKVRIAELQAFEDQEVARKLKEELKELKLD